MKIKQKFSTVPYRQSTKIRAGGEYNKEPDMSSADKDASKDKTGAEKGKGNFKRDVLDAKSV